MTVVKKTILFVVTFNESHKTGVGGSFQDVRALSQYLPDAHILVLGASRPDAFSGLEKVSFCDQSRSGIREFIKREKVFLRSVKVVHTYDRPSYILGGWIAIKLQVPLVLTKPGGPMRTRFYPLAKNMIVVQKADYVSVKEKWPCGPSKVALIANRVPPYVLPLSTRRRNPFDGIDKDTLKVLCIARMCTHYRNGFIQSINLVRRLNAEGIKACLVIVGEPSENEVYEFLRSQHDGEIVYVQAGKEFVSDAFEHITYADVCIGAGRVAMEAMSAGKLVFFPSKLGKIPCFLAENTYPRALENNFSSRTLFNEEDIERSYTTFVSLLRNEIERKRLLDFLSQRFSQDLDVRAGIAPLLRFYQMLEKEKISDRALYFVQHVFAHVWSRHISPLLAILRVPMNIG